MIDTDKYEGLIDAEGYIDYDGLDHLLTEVKRLREIVKKQEARFDVLRRFERRMHRTYTVYCSHDDEYSEADPCGTIGRLVDRVTEISNMVIE